ncbi:MAG: hypothetical protein M0Z81_14805 [Deltaproteobacteria bacterium]|jgi:hypothetical protein|nr:hypothetical protein [Deltaproteobacteria bacterium]
MSSADSKPIVKIPSLEELEKMVLDSLQQEASSVLPSSAVSYSWEDFIDN